MAWVPYVLAGLNAADSLFGGSGPTNVPAPVAGGGVMQGQDPLAQLFMQLSMPRQQELAPGQGVLVAPPATPAVGNSPTVPLSSGGDQQQQKTKKKGAGDNEIGDILAALPEAIAIASDLLGLNTQDARMIAPPAGGGGGGGLVQSLQAPRPQNLGDILNSIPRVR